jgi:nicotinate (nicotinamide) nucleotide adenylyltransferase
MDETIEKLRGKIKKIGVMGGTFDPIHYGHLVTAETVREKYNLDRVLFIPSGIPPHKRDINVTPPEHRYVMAQMATSSNPSFEVLRIEIDREGYTYTIDTVRELKHCLGDIEILFITGADAMLEILTWRDVGKLLHECSFIAVSRPGYKDRDLVQKKEELKAMFDCDITIMDVPEYAISSTEIRDRVRQGKSIKYLVPQNVEDYIIKNHLYINM